VIQRGVRSIPVFHSDKDRGLYLTLLAEHGEKVGLEFWAWCLMTNHIHLVVVPKEPEALAAGLGEAHRRYSRHLNRRENVRGHLFQERFHSFPIQSDRHLFSVLRYVELNPVRAGLARRPEEYRWSSARHHALGKPDALVKESPVRESAADWIEFLNESDDDGIDKIRRHARTGRPLGEPKWVLRQEKKLGRPLLPSKSGWPKGRRRKETDQDSN
jgi:putative transposase